MVLKTIQFIKDRLNETSTYVMVAMGAASASALTSPWSFIVFGAHVIAAMLPDKKVVENVLDGLKQTRSL